MNDSGIRHFLCETIDKSVIRSEWEKWLRSLQLYLDSEDIENPLKRRHKLLHLGGPQLQTVAYNLPGALESYNPKSNNDVYQTLVSHLTTHFSPTQNSTFERHIFRALRPAEGEPVSSFILKLRGQAAKCNFGSSQEEALEINIKDKLIDAWASPDLRLKLLEKERSLTEVIELCRVQEQITPQAAAMGVKPNSYGSSLPVNKIQYQGRRPKEHSCQRCGRGGHFSSDPSCPARSVQCHSCGFRGHFSKCCKTSKGKKRSFQATPEARKNQPAPKRGKQNSINLVEDNIDINSSADTEKRFECFKISNLGTDDDTIKCQVGGIPITLLIDSGSKANIVTGEDWATLTRQRALIWNVDNAPSQTLRGYAAGQPLDVKCKFHTTVSIPERAETLTTFYVIQTGDISILGKDTAKRLGILKLGLSVRCISVKTPFPKIPNVLVKLTINPLIKPVKQPPRRIPISVEKQVEDKLQEALQSDIIERVTKPSPWVSPIVVIFKPSGDIRLCVDMRRANEAIMRENYPLPTFDSFMTKLRNAQYFSRLDLANAYHQLELDEDSRPITTFITHKGMFRYKRLLFGVNSAPEIFQRVFEELLAPCSNCLNYLDDIIVFGGTEGEHDYCLNRVLAVLRENNVQLNESKCLRKVQQLPFLGHILSPRGIEADPHKIKTILEFRAPQSIEEVRSFLGLVTYVGKFIPDLGTVVEPLRQLLRNAEPFLWTAAHQQSFEKLKRLLAQLPTLSYFDPRRRTQLVADASPVALGAVLLQFDNQQTPQVISFASKSLSSVERRYSQTEKESLALVWGVERFYYYLAGLEFELITDHKPLEAIFKPTSKPPARIERWVLRLQGFKFRIVYRPGKSNIADTISRLCQLENAPTFDNENDYHVHTIVERSTPKAVSLTQIGTESIKDTEILEAARKLRNVSWTWADKNPYFPYRQELTMVGPILLRGQRIVIPTSLRSAILGLAHEGHPGETVMKRRLRTKVWWPLIDRQTEQWVKDCRDCLLVSLPDRPPPMTRHRLPDRPWQCLAIDLLGPLPNHETLLVIVDYYSRYHEIKFLKTTTSKIIVDHLREIFSRLGIPESLRTDNGPQFTSQEFRDFCTENNILRITTPPYWPQANGEVENLNRSILKRLKICHTNRMDYRSEIQKYLLMYNGTPHSTTGKSPAQLLFGRQIRDKIPSIQELDTNTTVDDEVRDHDFLSKQKGKEREDAARHATTSSMKPGDLVLSKNIAPAHKLDTTFNNEDCIVTAKDGSEVILTTKDGHIMRRHVSHLKKLHGQTHESLIDSRKADTGPRNNVQTSTTGVPPLRLEKKEGLWRPKEM